VEVRLWKAVATLSRLVRRVAEGEEIVMTRRREPVARLVRVAQRERRPLGADAASVLIADNFDAPLDDTTLAGFDQRPRRTSTVDDVADPTDIR
jgi:prevent-host-death family protein